MSGERGYSLPLYVTDGLRRRGSSEEGVSKRCLQKGSWAAKFTSASLTSHALDRIESAHLPHFLRYAVCILAYRAPRLWRLFFERGLYFGCCIGVGAR